MWTIGWGTHIYPNNTKVKKNDTITEAEANLFLQKRVVQDSTQIESAIGATCLAKTTVFRQNQFDALVSWTYNFSPSRLMSSTLLKLIKANPNNPKIRDEWMLWVNSNGKPQDGLKKRRKAEVDLYFSK